MGGKNTDLKSSKLDQCDVTESQITHHHGDKQRSALKLSKISLISLIVTFVAFGIIIMNVLRLYQDLYKLQVELYEQKEMFLTMLNKQMKDVNNNSISELVPDQHDTLLRSKRDDARSRNRNNNRGRSSSNNENSGKALHMVINMQHPQRDMSRDDLRTGQRGEIIPYWKLSDDRFNYDQSFAELVTPHGYVKIKQAGMYLIYTQITYYDRTGRWSHMVKIGEQPFIKCLASEWGIDVDPDTGLMYNTIHQCYTSAVTYIERNKHIRVLGMYPERIMHEGSDMTFWGIVKLT